MEETHLYRKIAEEIRQEILRGKLNPGDRLPSVRQMAAQWGCTVGTVQRAYQELALLGLVVSRAGQGTRVVSSARQVGDSALRWASLVHRSEAFLLEVLTAGYSPPEIDAAMRQAMERWQVIVQQPSPVQAYTLRFAGSHDPVLAWLGAHFPEIVPAFSLQLGFTGSLGGLIALAEGKADLAGCHLWDAESDSYNAPFVRRLAARKAGSPGDIGAPPPWVVGSRREPCWLAQPGRPGSPRLALRQPPGRLRDARLAGLHLAPPGHRCLHTSRVTRMSA